MINGLTKKKILEKIKPDKKTHKKNLQIANEIVDIIQDLGSYMSEKFLVFFGGSFAKNTYLKNDFDIDIFIQFQNNKLDDFSMSKIVKKILEKIDVELKIEKGSRDYFSFKYKNIKFEVVPTLRVGKIKEYKNTTDLSIFHVKYIIEKSKKNKNLCDEIRLTKMLFKAQNFYGAESYIGGFSGHSIDILISHFKTLNNFLKAAKKFRENEIINPLNIEVNMDEDKKSNLIIVDSVVPNRNCSKALCEKVYLNFLLFLKENKKLEYRHFKIEKINFDKKREEYEIYSKANNLFFKFCKFDIKNYKTQDIVGAKILKIFERTKSYYEKNNFRIFKSDFFIDFENNTFYYFYLFENKTVPKVKHIYGPSIFDSKNFDKFVDKREKIFIKDSKVLAEIKIKKNKLDDYFLDSIKKFQKIYSKKIDFIKK